ncbi:MAG: 23S rRNA (adenine(2503)-C(2))-methyltransferase RlmN [Bacilli bacterium]|nr:23S rRNA (adenine(2503)-C(2))-methyltransferase RlmN [Bacilli bacterium]
MENIYDFTLDKLADKMESLSQKRFRATQLFTWLYKKRVNNFDAMSDVAQGFRQVLKEIFAINLPEIQVKQIANDGTIKLLLKMNDGALVETVLMRYEYGNAICVSSQVGCNMGCAFCASGLLKKQRDLTVGEMVGQLLVMENVMESEKISHIVVMGTGEPFDNYQNVMDFISIANNPKAFEIGARHISVSTCGIVPKIIEYSKTGLQVNLAISLHASNDETRSRLMKINNAYSINELIDAVKYYEKVTKRRVTFEYIMLEGINDSLDNARELVKLIKGMNAYVNLIPYNVVGESPFKRSSNNRIHIFCDYLKENGINVTIRKEFGHDIDAACGQLRAKKEGVIK